MALRVADAVTNAACKAAVDLVDGGGGDNGKLQFYSGTKPSAIDDAPGGTLLAELDFANPAFDDPSGGEAAANDVPLATTGLADGTLGFARVVDTDGNVLWDEDDISTDANSAITVNTVTVSVGVAFEVTSYTFFAAA